MMTTNSELIVAGKITGSPTGVSPGGSMAGSELCSQIAQQVGELSVHLELLGNCSDDESRALGCKEFLTSVQELVEAIPPEMRNLEREALAMATFLKELCEKPAYLNASILRTLSLAVEVMGILARQPGLAHPPAPNCEAVVIDSEIVSSTASCNALRNVNLEPHAFGDAEEALKYLGAHEADLILLDTSVTGQGGFSVYKGVRALLLHAETPVIFLSSAGGAKTEEDLGQEGTQILNKPYTMVHYLELALKALSRVLKHRAIKELKAGGSPVKIEPALVEDFSELQESHTKLQEAHKKLCKELEEAQAALEKEQQQRRALARTMDELATAAPAETKKEVVVPEHKPVPEAEGSELEASVRGDVAFRARATADLEQARGERRRAEQRAALLGTQLQELHTQLGQHLEAETAHQKKIEELELQLSEKDAEIGRVNAELDTLRSENELAQKQLLTTAELTSHLRDCLSSFELAKQSFKRTQEEMEARLQANVTSVTEAEAKLNKEISERQRAEEALAAAQRSLAEQSKQSTMEISKLRSALDAEEIERKRLAGEALQARCANLDSARVGLTALNKVRGQVSPLMEKLLVATRHLLEVQLDEATRKLAESILENAMLMQNSLQDSAKHKNSNKAEKTEPPPLAAAA